MSTVNRIDKDEEVLTNFKGRLGFQRFIAELPEGANPDHITVKLSFDDNKRTDEEWIEDALSSHQGKGFGKTRVFEGDMKLPLPSNKPIHLVEEVEFNSDGSTKKVRYYNPDY